MKVSRVTNVIVELDRNEQWIASNRKGHRFRVEKIHGVAGSDFVTIRGRGISANDESLLVERDKNVSLAGLPESIVDRVKHAFKNDPESA